MLNDLNYQDSTDLDVDKLVDSTLDIKFSLDPHFASRYGFENIPKPADMAKFFPKENRKAENLKPENPSFNHARACMPMHDAMKLGYGIPLWKDLYMKDGVLIDNYDNGVMVEPSVGDGTKYNRLGGHPWQQIEGMSFASDKIKHGPTDTSTGEVTQVILPKLICPWKISITNGWSVLLVPPLNNFDLPIQPFSGLVDTDKMGLTFNLPCYMRDKTYTGVIERGTIIGVVIPIPRVQRKTKVKVYNEEDKKEQKRFRYIMETSFKDAYLNNYRDKRR